MKKLVLVLFLGFTLFSTLQAQSGKVLHVVNDVENLAPTDKAVNTLLEETGLEFELVNAAETDGVGPLQALDYILIVLEESCSSGDVKGKFKYTGVPVVHMEPFAWYADGALESEENRGWYDAGLNDLQILEINDFTELFTEDDVFPAYTGDNETDAMFLWGKPGGTPIPIAKAAAAEQDQMTVFAYNKGDNMALDFFAPAKRFMFGLGKAAGDGLSGDAAVLLETGVRWCLDDRPNTKWIYKEIKPQAEELIVEYDVVPDRADSISFAFGLMQKYGGSWGDFGAYLTLKDEDGIIIGKKPDDSIPDSSIVPPLQPGGIYHIRLTINVWDQIYDLEITPPDGETVFLGLDYGFRNTEIDTIKYFACNNWEGKPGFCTILNFQAYAPGESRVKEENTGIGSFALAQNYPNPFNPVTTIAYHVDRKSPVTLTVYNTAGQKIAVLVDEIKQSGFYITQWDGSDAAGVPVSTGLYFYKMQVDGSVVSKKMMLVR